MVEPALDGPREIVEFGKNRAKRPADNRVATIRAAGRQVCTSSARMSAIGE
jgi:hypothetical protein